jgi:hypothetical protein
MNFKCHGGAFAAHVEFHVLAVGKRAPCGHENESGPHSWLCAGTVADRADMAHTHTSTRRSKARRWCQPLPRQTVKMIQNVSGQNIWVRCQAKSKLQGRTPIFGFQNYRSVPFLIFFFSSVPTTNNKSRKSSTDRVISRRGPTMMTWPNDRYPTI